MAALQQDLTDHIELHSGQFLNLADPQSDRIRLEDVAHGLAYTCRFAGHTRCFYSVAEHACLVAWKIAEEGHDVWAQWAALHHDDAEAFIGDVSRPLKNLLPEYQLLETEVWGAIERALDLRLGEHIPTEHAQIKAADNWALSAEAWHLLPSKGVNWFCAGMYDGEEALPWKLGADPDVAEAMWATAYGVLRARIGA
jgi:hypothetical protein